MNRRQALKLTAFTSTSTLLHAQPSPNSPTDEIEHTPLAAKNAEIIRRQNDLLNQGNIAAATQYVADDASNHGVQVGRQGLVRVLTDILTTFPDWNMHIFKA